MITIQTDTEIDVISKERKLVVEALGVIISEWARENKCSKSCLCRTASRSE